MTKAKSEPKEPDVIAELRRLGRQLGDTLGVVWHSAERKRMEEDLRAGARAFAEELEQAMGRARSTRPADVSSRARRSAVDGLRWMSAELEDLAARFTPAGTDEGTGVEDEGKQSRNA
jgi:hypothetical protein